MSCEACGCECPDDFLLSVTRCRVEFDISGPAAEIDVEVLNQTEEIVQALAALPLLRAAIKE